jgi:molybdate transport system substrate-binding protein
MRRLSRIIALSLLLVAAAPGAALAATVTVFAAASLKESLDEAARAYEARSGDVVRVSYGASSSMARQIEQGAPADLFISADVVWMDHLAKRRLIREGTRLNLLGNRLVLVAPAGSRTRLRVAKGMPLAGALGGGRLALAGPQVPAGAYAREALAALGVWPSVAGRVVDADNVRAALQFVARGEAPFGVVYATDAKVERKVRVVGAFPAASHAPITYPAAVVATAKGRDAEEFLRFLAGGQGRAIFQRHGFTAPPPR